MLALQRLIESKNASPWLEKRKNKILPFCTATWAHRRVLFRSTSNNRVEGSQKAITPDAAYKMVQNYSEKLGFKIGAHSLRATAATNALDHQADIARVQEWLGHANIATTRIDDHRKTRLEDSPTFKVVY